MRLRRIALFAMGLSGMMLLSSPPPSLAASGTITGSSAVAFQGVTYKAWTGSVCNPSASLFQMVDGVDGRLFDVSVFASRGSTNIAWDAVVKAVPAAAASPGSSLAYQTFRADCVPTASGSLSGNGAASVPGGSRWMLVQAVQAAGVTLTLS